MCIRWELHRIPPRFHMPEYEFVLGFQQACNHAWTGSIHDITSFLILQNGPWPKTEHEKARGQGAAVIHGEAYRQRGWSLIPMERQLPHLWNTRHDKYCTAMHRLQVEVLWKTSFRKLSQKLCSPGIPCGQRLLLSLIRGGLASSVKMLIFEWSNRQPPRQPKAYHLGKPSAKEQVGPG